MLYRLILPDWAIQAPDYDKSKSPKVIEADLTDAEMLEYNKAGYNAYFLPNGVSSYDSSRTVDGKDIDNFNFVFVDCDLKMKDHDSKENFIALLLDTPIEPTTIIDSGNGIHAYWQVTDLDVLSFLRLNRRLCRKFVTDPAVSKIFQLMRVPNTINWKDPENPKLCQIVHTSGKQYTAEELDKLLPKITAEDETYCKLHHDKTYGLIEQMDIPDELPSKWYKFAKKGSEAHTLFYSKMDDRSKADFRLAHLMYANNFTKEEAMAVLMSTNKASTRAGPHQYSYAEGIVSKIWVLAEHPETIELLSKSARSIISKSPDDDSLKGVRFECDRMFDATEHGFRLTQVLGEIGGAGAGKTALGFNFFLGFAEKNPDYIHLAVTLEQPIEEYAQRWNKITKGNLVLQNCVYLLGNYNDDGTYRNLSLHEIEEHVKQLEKVTGKKVGCVMIDHIGVLKKESKNGENNSLMDICQYMKAFAVNTNTFLIMQSQAPRSKAGIGDLELDKDAAYGTTMFEWYCDYVVTTWQPLKRTYEKRPDMTVTCFKFCKIRHKNVLLDSMKEDLVYAVMFNPETERLSLMSEVQMQSYRYLNKQCADMRGRDKRTDTTEVNNITWLAVKRETTEEQNG